MSPRYTITLIILLLTTTFVLGYDGILPATGAETSHYDTSSGTWKQYYGDL